MGETPPLEPPSGMLLLELQYTMVDSSGVLRPGTELQISVWQSYLPINDAILGCTYGGSTQHE